MIKLLVRYLVPLVLLLSTFLVGYNYFLGNEEEKEQSRQIVAKVTNLGRDILGLLQSEKEKFDAGKYDDAIGRIQSGIDQLTRRVSEVGASQEIEGELRSLRQERDSIIHEFEQLKQASPTMARQGGNETDLLPQSTTSGSSVESLNSRIRSLVEHMEQIGKSMTD